MTNKIKIRHSTNFTKDNCKKCAINTSCQVSMQKSGNWNVPSFDDRITPYNWDLAKEDNLIISTQTYVQMYSHTQPLLNIPNCSFLNHQQELCQEKYWEAKHLSIIMICFIRNISKQGGLYFPFEGKWQAHQVVRRVLWTVHLPAK